MEQVQNAVFVQGVTLSDIERMIRAAVRAEMEACRPAAGDRPPLLIRRKDAAVRLGISLPTLDAYGKAGILHPRHVGGRVFYDEDELAAHDRG